MSDNLLEFPPLDDGFGHGDAGPDRAAPPTDSVPRAVAALSNSWLWIGIGLVCLWLMSNGH